MATIQTEVPNEIWHMIHDGPEETSTGDYVAVVQKPGVDTDSNSSDSAAIDEDGIRYAMQQADGSMQEMYLSLIHI